MSNIAWIFMIVSWTIVTTLFVVCVFKVLCADKVVCIKDNDE